MKERKSNWEMMLSVSGLMILALACVLLCCPPNQRPEIFGIKAALQEYRVNYGLDLKGGSELLYQINPKDIDPNRSLDEVMEETKEIIAQRIDESRIVKDARIQKQGTERLLIQLPGLNQAETDLIKKEIETLGNLEFRLVASKKLGKEVDEEEELSKYEQAKQKSRLPDYERNLLKQGYRWFATRDSKKEAAARHLLWVNDGYNFTGNKFQRFYPTFSDDGQVVGFELKEEFKPGFARFTEKYKGQRLAIVFNNKVVAAPGIRDRIPGIGIMVGFQPEELKELLRVMRSGSLELQPELINENTIGPSLGEDTINLGITAGWLGMAFVMAFMTLYYLAGGFVASLAGMLNVLLIGAVMVISRETLTLPGIAGVMLTLGMSVDANVLIFERIREEKKKRLEVLKGNKSASDVPAPMTKEEMLEHTDKGFENAFSAIFDSNITTLITAIILYIFASGPVQGFAFTLGVGLLANFFTAIVATRVMLHFLVETRIIREMAMMEWVPSSKIPFGKLMFPGVLLSLTCIIIGLAAFIHRGDANYGLDLKGGLLAQISLEKPMNTKEVRTRMSQKFTQLEVQHIVTDEGSSATGWYEFAVRLPNLHQKEIEVIDGKLREIARSLRPKNEAIQNYSNKLVRAEEEELRDAKKELRKLEEVNGSKEQMADLRERIKISEKDIDKLKESITALTKEVDLLKSERSKLISDKNRLAGIDELRREIETQFKGEISPLPFGQLAKPEKVKWSSYYQIDVNFAHQVSPEFVTETIKKQASVFKEVVLGSKQYFLSVKPAATMANPDKELAELVQTQLEIARINVAKLDVQKITAGAVAGQWTVTLQFADLIPETTLREVLAKCEFPELKVSLLAGDAQGQKTYPLFLMLPYEYAGDKPLAELQKYVEENIRLALKETKYQEKTVYLSDPFPRFTQLSGVVAEAQKAKAVQAIILSMIALLIYIVLRFPNGLRFGVGAIVGLVHDVLLVIGAIGFFAWSGLLAIEIDLTAISAFLTLVGYAINDTIVNYDRIRENQQKHETWDRLSKQAVTREYELALNQTLSRTLITGCTTLFVLGTMFVLNLNKGNALDGFSMILIVGILAGTYASLFIASYIVLILEKKVHMSE